MPITPDRYDPDGLVIVDTEAPALDARPFVIAALVYHLRTNRVTQLWTRRCPPDRPCNEWVQEHVLPVLDDPNTGISVDTVSYRAMLREWRNFYAPYRDTHAVLTHVGWPLEAILLDDAHRGEFMTSAPFPLIDLATTLFDAGHDPRSVDAYLAEVRGEIDGIEHHPLHDARTILAAWQRLRECRIDAYRGATRSPATWLRRSRCPHQDLATRAGTIETMLVDGGRKIWRCTQCGHMWQL